MIVVKLQNFRCLRRFDSAESISTIKNMIQTLLLQDFLKFFTLIPPLLTGRQFLRLVLQYDASNIKFVLIFLADRRCMSFIVHARIYKWVRLYITFDFTWCKWCKNNSIRNTKNINVEFVKRGTLNKGFSKISLYTM